MIELVGGRVSLAGRRVLDGLTLRVATGEIVALVGPSGAGKTTALRTLVRLVELDAGRLTVDGVDAAALDPCVLRRRVGLVAQTPAMLPGTVADNLRHGVEDLTDAELQAALVTAGLDESFGPRPAGELSGGERARVALARALTRRPRALLLDEPTAALDGIAAERVGESLRRLRGEGLAICVATHDAEVLAGWTDRQVPLP